MNQNKKKILFIVIGALLVLMLIAAILVYKYFYKSNININTDKKEYLYITPQSTFRDLVDQLVKNNYLKDTSSFIEMSKSMKLDKYIKSGKYLLSADMSNYELIKMLRSGAQEPVRIVIGKFRLDSQFKKFISSKLNLDSSQIQAGFDSLCTLRNIDTTVVHRDMTAYVIQNTYEFWWNTDAISFWKTLFKGYDKFWNTEHRNLAESINLTTYQVITLASIIEEETAKNDEKPRIAGVYLNRLKLGMPLQADPTVKFALKNFALKQILYTHLKTPSPYNTYQVSGLPPGPICIPQISSIESVLHYEAHDFIYFCAKDDFSGYHNFASTLQEHDVNAKNYQLAYKQKFGTKNNSGFLNPAKKLFEPIVKPTFNDLNKQKRDVITIRR